MSLKAVATSRCSRGALHLGARVEIAVPATRRAVRGEAAQRLRERAGEQPGERQAEQRAPRRPRPTSASTSVAHLGLSTASTLCVTRTAPDRAAVHRPPARPCRGGPRPACRCARALARSPRERRRGSPGGSRTTSPREPAPPSRRAAGRASPRRSRGRRGLGRALHEPRRSWSRVARAARRRRRRRAAPGPAPRS